MIRRLLSLFGLSAFLAAPLGAQTVDLSSRSFWIGEHPRSLDQDFPFVGLREIGWIGAFLGNDPVLHNAFVTIEQEGTTAENSVAETVARPVRGDVLFAPGRVPPQFALPGYRIFAAPVPAPKHFTYLPLDQTAGYIVHCTQTDDAEHFFLCVVLATYAPDDHIRLKANLHFPPDPADTPTHFRNVAKRIRELAHCLDVTDRLDNPPVARPDLAECVPAASP